MNIQEEIKEGLQLMGFYGVVIKIGIDNYSQEALVGGIVADSPCTKDGEGVSGIHQRTTNENASMLYRL